jgi:hypothetical protein
MEKIDDELIIQAYSKINLSAFQKIKISMINEEVIKNSNFITANFI